MSFQVGVEIDALPFTQHPIPRSNTLAFFASSASSLFKENLKGLKTQIDESDWTQCGHAKTRRRPIKVSANPPLAEKSNRAPGGPLQPASHYRAHRAGRACRRVRAKRLAGSALRRARSQGHAVHPQSLAHREKKRRRRRKEKGRPS